MFFRHLDVAVVISQIISPVLAVILEALTKMPSVILQHIKMRQERKDSCYILCVQKREGAVYNWYCWRERFGD